jgi:hypothetical protein
MSTTSFHQPRPLSSSGQLNIKIHHTELAEFSRLIDQAARRDGTSRQAAMRSALLRGLQQHEPEPATAA